MEQRFKQQMPDVKSVRVRLDYDETTGKFTWKIPPKNRPDLFGTAAGRILSTGYRTICIDAIKVQAHRLAWLYVHGELPYLEIDHINGVKDDNRIGNLRLATRLQNTCNRSLGKNNKSGSKGVYWKKETSVWAAVISANRKRIHIGYFKNKDDAVAAYSDASKRLHGEFARAA